jgi:hypothetical protein
VVVRDHRERDQANAERDVDAAIHVGWVLGGRTLLHDFVLIIYRRCRRTGEEG